MADYWKKRLEELNQTTKKTSSSGYWENRLNEMNEAEKKVDADIAPAKSTAKNEENDQPLLMKAINKVGDFFDDSADVVEKILTGDIFKKDNEKKTEIAPTVTTNNGDDDGKFNLKDAASWAGNAAMSGLASFNKGITSTADLILGKPLQALGWENNPVSKMADYYGDQYTAWRNETAEDAGKLGGGKGLSIAGDLIEGAIAAVPNALAALMTAGASTGASMTSTGLQQAALYDSGNLLTKIGMKVTDMAKNPQYWTSFVQTYGNDYEEAKARGASDTAALYGATISSLMNAGVEIGIDGMSGIQGLPAKVMNGDKGAFFEWVESSLSEGGEEMVQGVISNIVSKVMYDDDTKVFDATEMGTNFAMGTAVGGILGGAQIGAVKGADAVSNAIQTNEDNKLTENEQKVVDKVVEDRIAEAEKDGNTLTAKEKNKIHEEVERDMERGYISTDTIEEVLGGESYKAYKDTVANEDALRSEFDALGDMKESELTVKQRERYNELKAKIAEMESSGVRDQFKSDLDSEMQRLTEGSRLSESYAERGRRGETFTADLTVYDEKQKAVVQKAIDSGILNNSNRTHEFVDMVAKISADKGVLFDFTNNEKLKTSGFAVDGKAVNGFVTKDGVTVNIDSQKSLNSVVGHEITHVLEGTELYTELQNVVKAYAETKGEYQGRYETLSALYKDIEGADIDAELTADLVGDYLFTDEDFVNNLSVQNRNVFQKIYDEIKYLYKVATAGSKEAREIERVKRAFDKAYKDGGKVADTKYSLSDSDGKQLTKEQSEYFKDSKMRDDNGNLKVMYHGSQDAGFHVFDSSMSDDGTSFFFVDRNDVAASYSGTSETYEAQSIRTAQDMNRFMESIDAEGYEVIEKDGKFVLLYEGERVADSRTAKGIYDEFCWYEGVGQGDANYKVYLNLKNPYTVDAKGYGWNDLFDDAVSEYFDYDAEYPLNTREVAEYAKANGYDGVIFKNIVDNGGYSNGDEGASTVAVAFDSNQIKSVANEKPTKDPDIRYSLSKEGETPKKHGRYHIKGEDVRYNDLAPVQDNVQDRAKDARTVSKTEQVAPVGSDTESGRLAWYNRYGERVRDVPVVDDAAPSEPSLEQLREELAEIEQRAVEVYKSGDVDALTDIGERHTEIANKIAQMEADESARVDSIDDSDAPPEVDAPYQDDGVTPADPFAERDIKDVGDRGVKAYMYENPEVKPFFQDEANILLGELRNTTKGERFYTPTEYSSEYGAESYGVWTGTSRQTTDDIAYLLDTLKYSYADIEKGLNAIIEDNGKENNAISKRIEFLLNDRLMKGHRDIDGFEIPPNQDYINLLNEKQITAYTDEARRTFFESVGASNIAPVAQKYETIRPKKETKEPSMKRVSDNIAPVKESGRQAEVEDGKIAKVMVGEPEVAQKKINGWQKFRTNFLDKNSVFEDLALKTKNRELMGKANFMLSSEARAQHMIGKGAQGVKSLNDIRAEVEQMGQTERFYDYMYHRHNVDRMSLEEKARPVVEGLQSKFGHLRTDQLYAIAAKEITDKTTEKTAQSIREAREYLKAIGAKNKPVFGEDVTAEKSQEMVDFYERTRPQFKRYAYDVYTYMNHLRGMMVENGVISQGTADLWQEMYPHYVPIRRDGKSGLAVNVPLDTGRTGINAPIKRAVGGNSAIMDMFDTMAMRTEQTYRAIAKNSFGVELKNTLGTVLDKSAASVDEVIDSIDTHEELLKKGENGANPTFTVFEDGERVEFEITEEMYDALKPTSDGLKYVIPVANTVSNFHKGVLTEYNPVFSMTNAIKDAQDILMNSRHAAKTYANMPNALWQMAKGGKWYTEYMESGGEQNTYFDNQKNVFKKDDTKLKKALGLPLRGISWLNNKVEMMPRLAEYIASRKNGESVEVAMLDAARVTTNFSAGGDVAKFADRNGVTFLNASIQGFNQQVRNVREAKANGLKGWLQLAAKTAIAGIPALILNDLLWDDDEEYEELSDYVKDSYYIVAKMGDGKFVRIPKGRTVAVIQDAMEQVKNALTGDDEVDLRNFLDIAFTNLAPNNPLDNNIIAPVVQAVSNRAWYGEDIVPTRLQDMPSAEQYDEGTDTISKWLGEETNTSPMKWNYVMNQYGGGVADVVLPYLTTEAESGKHSALAPFRDKFTADSVTNNQNVSDFYDTVDELTKNANSAKATDEDVLKAKYMNSVNAQLSELYQQKREVQNSGLSDADKYEKVREIQAQIDSIAREGLDTYGNVTIDSNYATVGDREYRINSNGEWEKITDKQAEKQNKVTDYLGISESDYWSNKEEYDYAYDNPEKYAVAKSVGGYEAYKTYSSELYDIKADKDEDGKSITGSRKEKVAAYINGLDADYGEKIILFKSEYNADDTYNYDIIEYLNNREDITYEEMATILKELGFEVDSQGNISW